MFLNVVSLMDAVMVRQDPTEVVHAILDVDDKTNHAFLNGKTPTLNNSTKQVHFRIVTRLLLLN